MPVAKTIYEQDFQAWTLENAALLRQGKLADIDALPIALSRSGRKLGDCFNSLSMASR